MQRRRVYVGNLDFRTEDWQLEDYFMQFGDVESVRIGKDVETGRSRGFAFVTFTNELSAQKAIRLGNGEELEGRPIRVSETNNNR